MTCISTLPPDQLSIATLQNETLTFRRCNFKGRTWEQILRTLPPSSLVHRIVFNESPLDDEQFGGLAATNSLVDHLTSFCYQNTPLTNNEQITWICKLLKYTPALEDLRIECCNLTNTMVRILAQSLPSIKLTHLSLCANRITDRGAYDLALCLQQCTALRFLDLSENQIGNAGLQALARGLKSHASLLQVHLEGNSKNVGAIGVKDVIDHLPQLQVLDVSFHPKLRAAAVTKHALKHFNGNLHLNLRATQFTEDDAQNLLRRKRQRKVDAPRLDVDVQIDQISEASQRALPASNLGAIFHQYALKTPRN